ncbi:tyrosine-type recombinase/integrase [Photobacterium leiognathi]|uniref:tyrosine-type recombinase/integrase n=1 Tax=Photobacterium leiognathi TaxID=553611 RepID=UPI001EDD9946|nr:tyrosine-type recombinase/integrase [Photobacterium leiognathi]MCG3883937.1 tyrosine-type recombinase/integrase [Photobacterium leiognathi]
MNQDIIIYEESDGHSVVVQKDSGDSFGISLPQEQYAVRLLPAQSYLNELAPSSVVTIVSYLNNVASILNHNSYETCPWEKLTKDYVVYIIRVLSDGGRSPDTISSYLSAIKGVVHSAYIMGLMTSDDYIQIKAIKKPKGSRLKKEGVLLKSEHIAALIQTCQEDKNVAISFRDVAMISVLRGCGLRRAELVTLRLGDIDLNDRNITVIGKRNKQRRVWFGDQVYVALTNWIDFRSNNLSATLDSSEFVFTQVHWKGKVLEGSCLTSQSVYDTLKKRQLNSSTKVPKFAPHDIRRTYLTSLLDQGVALEDVQALAGHSSPETTKIYDLNKSRHLRKIGGSHTF